MQVVELLVAEFVGLKLLSVAVTHIVCTCRRERGSGGSSIRVYARTEGGMTCG